MAVRNANLNGVDFQDTGSTQLNGAINNSVTTITVDSTTGFKSGGGTIRIGSELIDYTGVTATTFTGCTRGQYGTTAASHADNASVLEREVFKASDANDTFDALYDLVASNPAFWLNSSLNDVTEDFESYSTGTFTTTGDWTVTITNGGSGNYAGICEIRDDESAIATNKELYLRARVTASPPFALGNNTVEANLDVDPNKHYHFLVQHSASENSDGSRIMRARIRCFGTYITLMNTTEPQSGQTEEILIVALGSDNYDVYVNGVKELSNITATEDVLRFEAFVNQTSSQGGRTVTANLYVDTIQQSVVETP